VFFRAETFIKATIILGNIFTDFTLNIRALFIGFSPFDFAVDLFLISLLFITTFFNAQINFKKNFIYIGVMLIIILIFGQNKEVQFIYYQF